ncbi:hypothetical protein JVU11DRAFT_11131 [Chiua virens]|nr:hypothetical protein JVU11DRAFT_11131 [Chiua virens]
MEYREGWSNQEQRAFRNRVGDPLQWTYFRWKIAKVGSMAYVLKSPGTMMYCIAPTMRTVELDLLAERDLNSVLLQGAPTWLLQGLQIEEAMIILRRDTKAVGTHAMERSRLALACRADRLSSSIQKFLSDVP